MLGGEGPFDTVCFHAQQAIEKALKAMLAYNTRPIPRSHSTLNTKETNRTEGSQKQSLAKVQIRPGSLPKRLSPEKMTHTR
jgi:HEPN domain-containing protein